MPIDFAVVSRTATCLSVLVLTEDSGTKAFEALRALAKELLKQVDEHVHTNRISFEPVRNELALQALHANIWKSTKPKDRQKRVELIRTLATQVLLEDGWVLFHFDGDRVWDARDSSGSTPQAIEARAHARLTRLKTVVPFYSIEAWLFQNTHEAIRISQESYGGRDVEQFQAWAQDRTTLDEVLKPKEAVSLGAAHNLDLASNGFPTREVHAAGRSFAAAVDALKQDGELRDALARTYAY